MKKPWMLLACLAAGMMVSGVAAARASATGVAGVAAPAPKAARVASQVVEPTRMEGQVVSVDRAAHTYSVQAGGSLLTLPATGALPEVGQRLVITISCRTNPWNCTITIKW